MHFCLVAGVNGIASRLARAHSTWGGARLRDHTKLEGFKAADELVIAVHKATSTFPPQEQLGLVAHVRRAAMSAAANIVEGCARETSADLAKFMAIAYASAREAEYQIDVSIRLGYVKDPIASCLRDQATRSSFLLARLARQARRMRATDARRSRS